MSDMRIDSRRSLEKEKREKGTENEFKKLAVSKTIEQNELADAF
jgi:hypothetical protein